MLPLAALTLAWWLTGFTGAMMPGPISTMALVEGSRQGFRAGPLLTLGHALAELVMALALLVGLSDALQRPAVAGVIGVVGGIVLLWMGMDIARAAWLGRVVLGGGGPPVGFARLGLVPAGAVASLVNPYWLLWWATVGAAALLQFLPFGLLGFVAFFGGHILSDLAWNSFLAAVVSSGRQVLAPRVYRGILLVCGAFLMLLSVWFVWSGVGFLRSYLAAV
jgi:threonine/homoserine/homoserine lactone efflux protein